MHVDTLGVPYIDANGQVPFVQAKGLHCCYGYVTLDGALFRVWDARHEIGRCPALLLSPEGKISLLRTHSQSAPGYWRTLEVGDRVLVDMTETTARAIADEILSMREQEPGYIEAVQKTQPRRSAVVEDIASALMAAQVAATQTVTRGMLAAFEQTFGSTPNLTIAAFALQITYVSRTGETIDAQQWQRLHDDPSYELVAFDHVPIPGGGGRFAVEVRTRWIGVVIADHRGTMFETAVRMRHACDVPEAECPPIGWEVKASTETEEAAREEHAELVRVAPLEDGTPYCDAFARVMDRAGLVHFPQDVTELMRAAISEVEGPQAS